jgi:AI-2 transport protein TqsA
MATNRLQTYVFGLTLAILIGWLLQTLQFVFLPVLLATFITFLLTPLVSFLNRYKIPTVVAAILAIVLMFLVIFLGGKMILRSLVQFQREFPRYELQIQNRIGEIKELRRIEMGPLTVDRFKAELSKLSLSTMVGTALNSVFVFTTYLLITFVFAIYFLLGSPKLHGKITGAFPLHQAETINDAMESISGQVQRYIWAKTLTSIITGVCMAVVCLLFGVDFPITWGFFIFLLNWIPTIGVLAGCIPPPILLLISTGDWLPVIWLVVVLFIVFMTLGNYLEPKILGDSVNLSPLVALFALIIWGWLWGPAGMIVGVPVTALIKFTFDNVEGLRPLGALMGGKPRQLGRRRKDDSKGSSAATVQAGDSREPGSPDA